MAEGFPACLGSIGFRCPGGFPPPLGQGLMPCRNNELLRTGKPYRSGKGPVMPSDPEPSIPVGFMVAVSALDGICFFSFSLWMTCKGVRLVATDGAALPTIQRRGSSSVNR